MLLKLSDLLNIDISFHVDTSSWPLDILTLDKNTFELISLKQHRKDVEDQIAI
jgi:hypothetical protein